MLQICRTFFYNIFSIPYKYIIIYIEIMSVLTDVNEASRGTKPHIEHQTLLYDVNYGSTGPIE